jgi:heme/copper-type cytochrome/quinol oxidase subunit 2
MKERIHEQISNELKQAMRMDTITVIIAIVVSFTLFIAAMIFAASTTGSIMGSMTGFRSTSINIANTIIMFVVIIATVAIDWYAIRTLLNHKKQRGKLNEGLMKLYKDEGMDQYYDGSIFKGYETRYDLYTVILGAVGAVSVIAPLVMFIDKVVAL